MSLFRFVITEGATEKDLWHPRVAEADEFIAKFLAMGHGVGGKGGSGIIPATYPRGARLEDKNVTSVTGIIFDLDGKRYVGRHAVYEQLDVDLLLSRLPFQGVAHSSHSSTPEHPKFRIILPLAAPVDVPTYRRLWAYLFELLDQKPDRACANHGRMYYLPRCSAESKAAGHAWMRELHGCPLTPDVIPADFVPATLALPAPGPRQPAPYRQGAHDSLEERRYVEDDPILLLEVLEELPIYQWAREDAAELSREVWRGLGVSIAAAVLPDEDSHDSGAQVFHEMSEPDTERYSAAACDKEFRNCLKSAASPGPMTYATLREHGAPEDICEAGEIVGKSPIAHARRLLHAGQRAERTAPPPVLPPGYTAHQPPTSPPTTPPPAPKPVKMEYLNPMTYLFDVRQAGYLFWDSDDEQHGPFGRDAFKQFLISKGAPSLAAVNLILRDIPPFTVRRPVWNSAERFVTVNDVAILNTYIQSRLQPAPGNWDDIYALLMNLVGDDKAAVEYVLDWLAMPVQSLRFRGVPKKTGTALVFHGKPGSGKGTLSLLMEAIYGPTNCITLGQDNLDGRFHGNIVDKLFVVANEVISSTNRSNETANKLKPWITDSTIVLEGKNKEAATTANNLNMIFTSNDDRPVIIDKDDRRYSAFKSGVLDRSLADRLYADINGPRTMVAAFLDHLLNRQVTLTYGRIYDSVARRAMMRASAASDERFANDLIADGWPALSMPWADDAGPHQERVPMLEDGTVLSSTLLDVYRDYCRRNNLKPRGFLALTNTLTAAIPVATALRLTHKGTQVRGWKGLPVHGVEPELAPPPPPPATPVTPVTPVTPPPKALSPSQESVTPVAPVAPVLSLPPHETDIEKDEDNPEFT